MLLEKIWKFLWKDDSIWSWLVSIILAFLIVKFVLYPLLGLILGTNLPIVAVVSESMEHNPVGICPSGENCNTYSICGNTFDTGGTFHFDRYWEICGGWYSDNNITKTQFEEFSFKNGFNKGDVMLIIGKKSKDIKVGDIIVFDGGLEYPIIHRVVDITKEGEAYYFKTKGDNNPGSNNNEERIPEDNILGKAVLRLPLLGWIKIKFVEIFSIGGKNG